MTYQKVLWFLLAAVGLSECAFVDTLKKCHIKDEQCQIKLLQTVLTDASVDGIPELNIPPFDPISLTNLNVSILNILDLKLIEGTAKGVKNCIVNKFKVDLEKLWCKTDFTCDIVIKGKYHVQSNSPIFQNLLGGPIHGDGNGKAKIDKINLKVEYPVKVLKRGDDTFLISEYKKMKYTFDVLGKLVLAADQLYLGDKESSKDLINLLNDNWRLLVSSFGSHVVELALKVLFEILSKFYVEVPTKHFLIEDLSQYVK